MRGTAWVLAALAAAVAAPPAAGSGVALVEALPAPIVGAEELHPRPLALVSAGDRSRRLFLVDQVGRIFVHDPADEEPWEETPFLDLRDRVRFVGEEGLLGLAFDPDYEVNGRLFTYYTNAAGDQVVARFTNDEPDDDVVSAASEVAVVTIPHPFSAIHNGGGLAFGPHDGYLYISIGDGASPCDPAPGSALGNGQWLDTWLGKVLRLDVDGDDFPSDPLRNYAVPIDNPFVDGDPQTRDEIWAHGLRHPWRTSIDRMTGDLWIGDVGQEEWEEINLLPAGIGGGNFGWVCCEGARSSEVSSCTLSPARVAHCASVIPDCAVAAGSYRPPVIEYPQSAPASPNCAVVGGVRYRGPAVPDLARPPRVVLADYCSGRVWAAAEGSPGAAWNRAEIADAPFLVPALGEDERGELYLVESGAGAGGPACLANPPTGLNCGRVFRLVDPAVLFADGFELGDLADWPTRDSGH